MTPERWARIRDLFDRASQLPAGEREAWVSSQCPDDDEVARTVISLLGRLEASKDFLEPIETATPPVPTASQAGRRLGDFELVEPIGRGGMGVVHRARQVGLGRDVAVKELPTALFPTQNDVERFLREAKAAARLAHPAIVHVLAFGEDAGTHWFAMELVDGHDLARELTQQAAAASGEVAPNCLLPRFGTPQYVERIVAVVADVADALQHAHDRGIVHRDVKPSNLLLQRGAGVKVADFGLARDAMQGPITKSSDLGGTPYYVSPEQARSLKDKVDHRTDVYSLGVVLYEALTLRRPINGETHREVLDRIAWFDPPPPSRLQPKIARDLDAICVRAMEKDPARRYPTAAAFAADLKRFLAHEAVTARLPGTMRRVQRFAARNRSVLVTGVLVASALVLGAFSGRRNERAEALLRRRADVDDALVRATWIAADRAVVERALRAATELRVGAPDANDASRLERLAARCAEHRARWVAEADRMAQEAAASALPAEVRSMLRVQSANAIRVAAIAAPDDPELDRRSGIDVAMGRLSVRAESASGVELAARVRVAQLDFVRGTPNATLDLGATPVVDAPIAPGFARVTVEFDAGGFSEFDVAPGIEDDALELVAVLREDDADSTDGMVRLEGGTVPFGPHSGCPLDGREVVVAPFWIDATEVRVRDYREFLRATNATPPMLWAAMDDPANDELPVTGVTWFEARAYAVWRGKRLPTHAEWEFAARGSAGRLVPWAEGVPASAERARLGGPRPTYREDPAALVALWKANVVAVDALPLGRTPEGVFHLLGNVAEFTGSPVIGPVRGVTTCITGDRWVLGGAWTDPFEGFDLGHFDHMPMGANALSRDVSIGFRCARSAGR